MSDLADSPWMGLWNDKIRDLYGADVAHAWADSDIKVKLTTSFDTGPVTTYTAHNPYTGYYIDLPKPEEKNMKPNAVGTVGGYRAQILHNGVVVWESKKVYRRAHKASEAAARHIDTRLVEVFA